VRVGLGTIRDASLYSENSELNYSLERRRADDPRMEYGRCSFNRVTVPLVPFWRFGVKQKQPRENLKRNLKRAGRRADSRFTPLLHPLRAYGCGASWPYLR